MQHPSEPVARRLLVINPNTNPEVTRRVRLAALDYAGAGVEIHAVNPETGPFAIESPADRQAAVPHVVSIITAAAAQGFAGYILACFDDIGIEAGRRIVGKPLISLAEAGIRAAAKSYRRFAIVTTVAEAMPSIEALIAKYGVTDRCIIRATGIGVAEASGQTDRAERALAETIAQANLHDGAEAVLLGSGAYSGRNAELSRDLGIPVIDGLQAAILHCRAAR